MWIWFISTALGASLARPQAGPSLDLTAGIGWTGGGDSVSVAGQVALGAWFGRYDDDYAIGRHGWIGVTGRVQAREARVTVAPLLELRRGIDLLVVGIQPFLAGGAVIDVAGTEEARSPGWTVVTGVVTRYRRTRYVSLPVRVEGGVDVVEGRVRPTLALTVGLGWARPVGSKSPR